MALDKKGRPHREWFHEISATSLGADNIANRRKLQNGSSDDDDDDDANGACCRANFTLN